jgi:hypothetical protein
LPQIRTKELLILASNKIYQNIYMNPNFRNFNFLYSGVKSINDVFHIVNKVEIVLVYTHIFNLIDNVECVVYAFHSRLRLVLVLMKTLSAYLVLGGVQSCQNFTKYFSKFAENVQFLETISWDLLERFGRD